MDPTVSDFFSKGGDEYETLYRLDHGPRIRALLDRYDLVNQLKGKRVIDVGGGQGFLGEMLDPSTQYHVIDGATVPPNKRLCKGEWVVADLDYDRFAESNPVVQDTWVGGGGGFHSFPWPRFDCAFALEVLEHLKSPYHCIEQLKMLVKQDGDIFISVPDESVWHNTPNPFTFWPPQHFEVWLRQMALPVVDFYVYKPTVRGWPAYQFKCRNAAWTEAQMIYPKTEAKFIGKKPHEYANL